MPRSVFTYTGSDQSWTVPVGVSSIQIRQWGGGGAANSALGGGPSLGGSGGYVKSTHSVSGGETLTIKVGGGGTRPAVGSRIPGPGGGRSQVSRGSTILSIAGGGGGPGGYGVGTISAGGVGGGLIGGDSVDNAYTTQGFGGTQAAGGVAGTPGGINGASLQGGDGSDAASSFNTGAWPNGGRASTNPERGGGGGDGYFGGGGGGGGGTWGGGGGGGSSYTEPSATGVIHVQGINNAPPATDEDGYIAGIAAGGNASNGGAGLVLIDYDDSAGGVESYFSSAGPLGDFASIGNVNPAIFSQIAGPLGQVQAVAALRALAYAEIGSPLASPAALAALRALAYGSADSPLGALAAFGSIPAAAWASSPGPLDYAALALFTRQQAALAAIPGPLGVPSPRLLHDFTGLLGDATTYYVMDLIGGASAVRAPISSWQATLQTGLSNYVQCVVPAVGAFVDAINAASEFVIYRRVVAPGVGVVEYEMARAPVQTATFDQGPARYTCTISGYSSGFAVDEDPSPLLNRTLTDIRSVSISSGGTRVRCAIDWLLRPSQRVYAGSRNFIASYINYYVGNNDAYMDVGERA